MSKFQNGDPKLHKYADVTYTEHFVPDVLDRIRQHTFDTSDILVASFPKSGTTWMKTLVSLILSEGEVTDKDFPFLEIKYSAHTEAVFDVVTAKPPPHLFMTHLQFRFLEQCFRRSRPKVIYIMRNPFDQMVSFYHFCKMNAGLGLYTGSWDEFYEDLYKEDKLCFGDYFDHVTGWWDAREAHSDHILYVKYEDMLQDPRGALQRVAQFLGKELSEEVILRILEQSSFTSMKSNPKLNKDLVPQMKNDIVPFMRKGTAGDWKNFFSPEQKDKIEKLYKEKIVSRGLEFDLEITPNS